MSKFSVVLARLSFTPESDKPEQETYTATVEAADAYAAVEVAKKEAAKADNKNMRAYWKSEYGEKLPEKHKRTPAKYSVIMVFEGHPKMWFGFQVDP